MTLKDYEAKAGVLVLSADRVGGFVAPGVLINHITLTKIYGDGKVVFTDPAVGSTEIREGHLDAHQISRLFELLKAKGFYAFDESYFKHGPTDLPTNIITATRRGQPEKRVGCYGGAISAPPGFMDCYEALTYPHLQPTDVKVYERQPITEQELAAGAYYGFEYQKKLNTPKDWVWVDAGRSSQWRRPGVVVQPVTLDSGYMTPAVDGCRHLRVHYEGDPVAPGSTIQLDRNAMSPDAYGNIGVTTMMYFAPRAATFALLKSEGDKHLYSVTIAGYSGPSLRLVIFGELAHPSSGRLLVMSGGDAIESIHPLQTVPSS